MYVNVGCSCFRFCSEYGFQSFPSFEVMEPVSEVHEHNFHVYNELKRERVLAYPFVDCYITSKFCTTGLGLEFPERLV